MSFIIFLIGALMPFILVYIIAYRIGRLTERDQWKGKRFDLICHLHRQRVFSLKTFGPGMRTKGVTDHIKKELDIEIAAKPDDLEEWVDVILLALDGAWRAGHEPEHIVAGMQAKLIKNESRKWPDWRTANPDKAIEHVRDASAPASAVAETNVAPIGAE